MFSFAYTSEHINGIKGNLFTMEQILALFYLIAPLTTPLWLLWPGPSRALPRGWLWAVAGLRLCPKPAGSAALPTVALLPWLCWHTQLCGRQGEQLHLKPGHPPAGEVPELALCSSPQCSSSWSPWTPATEELLSLWQFLGWQQRDR